MYLNLVAPHHPPPLTCSQEITMILLSGSGVGILGFIGCIEFKELMKVMAFTEFNGFIGL